MVDFKNPIVMEEDFREYRDAASNKHEKAIEFVLRTVAVTKLWHALAGLYL